MLDEAAELGEMARRLAGRRWRTAGRTSCSMPRSTAGMGEPASTFTTRDFSSLEASFSTVSFII